MSLTDLSALEIGAEVNKKEVSAVEVTKAFLDNIERNNSEVNAFVYTMPEEALKEAEKIDKKVSEEGFAGIFAGVPVGLKDFLPSKKGWKNSHGGVRALVKEDPYDSEFYKAAKSLGAIAIGKTNAPAFGFRGVTDNNMYGPTSTPFKPGYNSGGSSGGSASAVASGFAPICEGGDAGGSIRIPSAWCGCFGFKPSAGIVPSVCRPDAWTATHPYCCSGPIARTVIDAEKLLEAMTSYNMRDPLSVPSFAKYVGSTDIKDLKIAFTTNFNLFPEPDSEIVDAMKRIANKMAFAGATVEDVTFNFKYAKEEYEAAWLRSICVDTALDAEIDKLNGFDLMVEAKEDLPEDFIKWNSTALNSSMLDYRNFHEIRTDVLDAHCDVFDKYDLIIAPVAGCMPVPNRLNGELTLGPREINGQPVDPLIGFSYTYLENMIGTPAASIPIGISKEGFPIGLQIIGPRYYDKSVFALSHFIEFVQPWYSIYSNIAFNGGVR